jgi:hypothetical protein
MIMNKFMPLKVLFPFSFPPSHPSNNTLVPRRWEVIKLPYPFNKVDPYMR